MAPFVVTPLAQLLDQAPSLRLSSDPQAIEGDRPAALFAVRTQVAPALAGAAPRAGELLNNALLHGLMTKRHGQPRFHVVPQRVMELYLPGFRTGERRHISKDSALQDAKAATAGWVVFSEAEGTVPAGRLDIDLRNLSTGKATTASFGWKDGEAGKAVQDALGFIARTVGWTPGQIKESGLLEAAMTADEWRALAAAPSERYPALLAAAARQAGPSSPVAAHAIRVSSAMIMDDIDAIVNRSDRDHRNLLAKAEVLLTTANRPMAALHLALALDEAHPQDPAVAAMIAAAAADAFRDPKGHSVSPVPEMDDLATGLVEMAAKHPSDWTYQAMVANALRGMALSVRGGETADKVKPGAFDKFGDWNRAAQAHLTKVRALLGDRHAALLRELINQRHNTGQGDDPAQLVELAYQVEPDNPGPLLTHAYYNSIGWGDQPVYEALIRKAVERHKDDPPAMRLVFDSVGQNFRRLPLFTNRKPAEHYLDPEGLGPATLEWLRKHYRDQPTSLTLEAAKQFHQLALAHGDHDLAFFLLESSGNPDIYEELLKPMVQLKVEDWKDAEPLSRRAHEVFARRKANGDTSTKNQENLKNARLSIIRSLWKTGRHEQALKAAEEGMAEFPGLHTFHYMFAVVADEAGLRPEETYRHALEAVRRADKPGPARTLYISICIKQGRESEVEGLTVPPHLRRKQ